MTIITGVSDLAKAIGADVKTINTKFSIPAGSVMLTGDYTVTAADKGKIFVSTSNEAITVTLPSTLLDGWSAHFYQTQSGAINLNASGRTVWSNSARIGTNFTWDNMDVSVITQAGTQFVIASFSQPLPTQYASSTAVATRANTTLTAIPGLAFPVLAYTTYAVDLRASFTSSITTMGLTLGFSDLPAGSTTQLEMRIQNTNVAGTSNMRMSASNSNTGLTGSGSGSVVGVTMLGTVTGRITIGATAGTLTAVAAGSASTGTITITSGAASLELRMVY